MERESATFDPKTCPPEGHANPLRSVEYTLGDGLVRLTSQAEFHLRPKLETVPVVLRTMQICRSMCNVTIEVSPQKELAINGQHNPIQLMINEFAEGSSEVRDRLK